MLSFHRNVKQKSGGSSFENFLKEGAYLEERERTRTVFVQKSAAFTRKMWLGSNFKEYKGVMELTKTKIKN